MHFNCLHPIGWLYQYLWLWIPETFSLYCMLGWHLVWVNLLLLLQYHYHYCWSVLFCKLVHLHFCWCYRPLSKILEYSLFVLKNLHTVSIALIFSWDHFDYQEKMEDTQGVLGYFFFWKGLLLLFVWVIKCRWVKLEDNFSHILSKIKWFPKPLSEENCLILDKLQMTLFSNFTSIPFD